MLREAQDRFAAALLSPDAATPDDIAPGGNVTAIDRLSVYRDNIRAGLHNALCEAYPAVRLLVGHEFMRMMALRYIDGHPPVAADINQYGADFSSFIANFTPAAELPYLPDVALLEWRMHDAAFAPDSPPLSPAHLSALPAAQQSALCLRLRPGISFIKSAWPLCAIRDFALAQHEDSVLNTDGGGAAWMIARPGLDVIVDELPASYHAFYTACDGATALDVAANHAAALHDDFDLAAVLTHSLRYGVFMAPPADR